MRAVARVAPAWLSADREDIVQMAMLRVVRLMEREGAPPGPAWLRRAAYSATVDEIRRRRSARLEHPEDVPDAPDPRAGPDGLAAGGQLGDAVQGCLGGLAESRRRAVTCHLQGHSVPETAKLLELSPKQAENLVYRGLADLRGCLEGKGFKP